MHKLETYTDKSLITKKQNNFQVDVYYRVTVDPEYRSWLKTDEEIQTEPGVVRFEIPFEQTDDDYSEILARAEMGAQVNLITPKGTNVFRDKKGVQTVLLESHVSQPLVAKYFCTDDIAQKMDHAARFKRVVSLFGCVFYGATYHDKTFQTPDWVDSLTRGETEPASYIVANESINLAASFVETKSGPVFFTRRALLEYLSQPHIQQEGVLVNRPYEALKGAISKKRLKEVDYFNVANEGDEERYADSQYGGYKAYFVERTGYCLRAREYPFAGKSYLSVSSLKHFYSSENLKKFENAAKPKENLTKIIKKVSGRKLIK
ncbi:hypothetical protein [Photobacterium lutimaris]|uniref:Uncharacterized protein n=1 Tax=Photobacterium lutimaris TaxID=388278 RepID=A0A2T3ITU6_9GAMM|nr:hypothetical protein [Photobacterium lutimaris]PSU31780.1 hypothetical protein C9I99_21590 [Photobacterium lutimaris]TDR72567.1 hypothetical protein DFP78_11343 [Photobacterium lutimaris]